MLQIPRNWICPSYRGTHSTGTKRQTNRGQKPQLEEKLALSFQAHAIEVVIVGVTEKNLLYCKFEVK